AFIVRSQVLKLYRKALRISCRAPSHSKDELRQEIRQEMEKNRHCNDKQRIRFLISEGKERGTLVNPHCASCSLLNESISHIFLHCPTALQLWSELLQPCRGCYTLILTADSVEELLIAWVCTWVNAFGISYRMGLSGHCGGCVMKGFSGAEWCQWSAYSLKLRPLCGTGWVLGQVDGTTSFRIWCFAGLSSSMGCSLGVGHLF
ncbi:Lyr motif-containing protein, partial [Thalictrum thalictroides]